MVHDIVDAQRRGLSHVEAMECRNGSMSDWNGAIAGAELEVCDMCLWW